MEEMSKGFDEEEALLLIRDCIRRSHKMNEWEKNFMLSIENSFHSSRLSDKQWDTLNKIWDRVT